MGQSVSPIRRRTESERAAYIEGFRAGIEAVAREVKRGYLGTDALDRARELARLALLQPEAD